MAAYLALAVPVDSAIGYVAHTFVRPPVQREETFPGPRSTPSLRIVHPVFHHGLAPFFEGEATWAGRRYAIRTNSLGFKDATRRTVPLETSRRRLLLMGDSFTEGLGVAYPDTFAGHIARTLERDDVEVLNGAALSYSPRLHFLKLRHLIEGAALRVDEIALFIDESDIQDELLYSGFGPADLAAGQRPPGDRTLTHQRESAPYDHSVVYNVLAWNLFGKRPATPRSRWLEADGGVVIADADRERTAWIYDEAVFRRWGQEGLARCAFYLQRIAELAAAHGIRLSVSVYPWPGDLGRDLERSKHRLFFQAESARLGIPFIDLFPVFQGGRPGDLARALFIENDAHWTEEGHRRVAERWLSERRRLARELR